MRTHNEVAQKMPRGCPSICWYRQRDAIGMNESTGVPDVRPGWACWQTVMSAEGRDYPRHWAYGIDADKRR